MHVIRDFANSFAFFFLLLFCCLADYNSEESDERVCSLSQMPNEWNRSQTVWTWWAAFCMPFSQPTTSILTFLELIIIALQNDAHLSRNSDSQSMTSALVSLSTIPAYLAYYVPPPTAAKNNNQIRYIGESIKQHFVKHLMWYQQCYPFELFQKLRRSLFTTFLFIDLSYISHQHLIRSRVSDFIKSVILNWYFFVAKNLIFLL